MTQTFAARAASTVSRAASALALGALGISVAFAQEASDEDDVTLPKMVVTSTRKELQDALSPGVVSVVYPDDAKGEHKSLPELLDRIPGVYVRRVAGTGQYTTASIRGSAPSQVNIYIDGVPFNLASETAADLSTIPISNVERVEVYRGTTPARFSGAPLGGAINIVTKKPEGLGGTVEAGVSSFVGRQGGASATAPLFGGTLLVGMNHDESKGNFKWDSFPISALENGISYYASGPDWRDGKLTTETNNSDIPVERTRRNNSYDKDDILVKWQDDAFYAKWAYTYMDRYLPTSTWGGQTLGPGVQNNMTDVGYYCYDDGSCITPRQNATRQKQGQHDAVVGWNESFGNLTLGLNLSMMNKSAHFEATDPPGTFFVGQEWTKNHTRRYGAAADAAYQLGDGWAVDQLLELHGGFYRETFHADMSGDWTGTDFVDRLRRYKTDIQAQNTFTLNFLDGLQITPLGRLERMDGDTTVGTSNLVGVGSNLGTEANSGWQPSGSISAKKTIGEGWQVFGSWGSYSRYPNFYEIYGDGIWVRPNIEGSGNDVHIVPLSREFGHNADVGFGWDGDLGYTLLGKDLKGGFRATYFERKTKNEITLYSSPVGARYVNSGDTYTHGGELEGYVVWGKRADLQFAVTRQEGWYQNDGYRYYGGSTPGQRYPGLTNRTLNNPDLVANLRLNLHWLDGDLVTFFETKHTGRVFRTVTGFERSLTTFDTGVHYALGLGAKVSFGVNDLFNQGPKQSYYAGGTQSSVASASGYDCSHSPLGEALCNLLNGGDTTWEYRPITYNVQYPQQGRTVYATLAWEF